MIVAGVTIKTRGGGMTKLSADTLTDLQNRLRGTLLVADDPLFEEARKVWNGAIDRRPSVIVRCQGTADVMAVVGFVRDHELAVSVRSGGHNVSGASIIDEGLVIDLSVMRSVHVDPDKRVASVEAGALLGDLDHETSAFGLAAPVGVVSETGVTGLTLHGGVGWLLRKHGMSIDNLKAVEIVTADAQLLRASRDSHSDLFWALRGGGGNFGVVTLLEFQLHPVGPEVFWTMPMYSLEDANQVVDMVQDKMRTAPGDMMLVTAFGSVPAIPEIDVTVHGQPAVMIIGCYSGPMERAEESTRPYRTAAKPIADLSQPVLWVQAQQMLDEDYPNGKLYYWTSSYLDRIDDEVLAVLTRYTGNRPSKDSTIDIWFLGGAMGEVPEDATAFYHRQHPFLVGIEANWDEAADTDANVEWARSLHAELEELSGAGRYLNFPGKVDQQGSLLQGVFGENLRRLQRVKREYDPLGVFPGLLDLKKR